MPAINIGDFQIMVQTVQQTQPALKFMDSAGVVYYAPVHAGACPNSLVVGDLSNPYTVGDSALIYEATTLDSCQRVSLQAGCYSVEVLGGRGGDGGNNAGSAGDATPETFSFSVSETTDVYVFRGGDGKAGGVNSSGGLYSGGGGGASGVPSFFAVGSNYIISQGGTGGDGSVATKSDGTDQQ